MMSRDRIPEIKMATAMFKVVHTPECYHDKKEDTKATTTTLIDDAPMSTETGNTRWRLPDRK
jgi:hypothetical protein